MKWNLTHYMHESVLKQDKRFCGFSVAFMRSFKWELDFHGDDFVGFLWVQNFVRPMSTLWIWDLCWPWKLSMAYYQEVCSIGLLNELLKCTNWNILLDFFRSCWIWKCLMKLVTEAHPEVIARMKEIEIYCFNLWMWFMMVQGATCQIQLSYRYYHFSSWYCIYIVVRRNSIFVTCGS